MTRSGDCRKVPLGDLLTAAIPKLGHAATDKIHGKGAKWHGRSGGALPAKFLSGVAETIAEFLLEMGER